MSHSPEGSMERGSGKPGKCHVQGSCHNPIAVTYKAAMQLLWEECTSLPCQLMVFPFNIHSPPALESPQAPSWQKSQGVMSCHSTPCPETALAVVMQPLKAWHSAKIPPSPAGTTGLHMSPKHKQMSLVLFKLENRVRLQWHSYRGDRN